MRFRLEFHPLVRIDVAEASVWYEQREPGVGARLEADTRELFRCLGDEALLYAVRFSDIRRANLRKFPYGIFYFVVGQSVVVLGVFHAARDSGAALRRRRQAYG